MLAIGPYPDPTVRSVVYTAYTQARLLLRLVLRIAREGFDRSRLRPDPPYFLIVFRPLKLTGGYGNSIQSRSPR